MLKRWVPGLPVLVMSVAWFAGCGETSTGSPQLASETPGGAAGSAGERAVSTGGAAGDSGQTASGGRLVVEVDRLRDRAFTFEFDALTEVNDDSDDVKYVYQQETREFWTLPCEGSAEACRDQLSIWGWGQRLDLVRQGDVFVAKAPSCFRYPESFWAYRERCMTTAPELRFAFYDVDGDGQRVHATVFGEVHYDLGSDDYEDVWEIQKAFSAVALPDARLVPPGADYKATLAAPVIVDFDGPLHSDATCWLELETGARLHATPSRGLSFTPASGAPESSLAPVAGIVLAMEFAGLQPGTTGLARCEGRRVGGDRQSVSFPVTVELPAPWEPDGFERSAPVPGPGPNFWCDPSAPSQLAPIEGEQSLWIPPGTQVHLPLQRPPGARSLKLDVVLTGYGPRSTQLITLTGLDGTRLHGELTYPEDADVPPSAVGAVQTIVFPLERAGSRFDLLLQGVCNEQSLSSIWGLLVDNVRFE